MAAMLLRLVCVGFVILAQGAWAGEEMVYAVVYKGTGSVAVKTEILSIDPETAERRLLFSDENTAIVLQQHLYVFHFPVAGGGSLFAHAAQRGKRVPWPGNASLYELSVDGSNSFRRIAPVLGEESMGDLFVNSSGTRIGHINRMNQKRYIFVHDIVTGKLLHQVDITDIFLDCFAASIGWLPDSEQLYFSLQTGDDHITSDPSYGRVGTYLLEERGEHLTKLSSVPALKGFHLPMTATMIGILPDGDYVFETRQRKKRSAHERSESLFAVVKLKNDPPGVEDISFSPATNLYSGIRVSYQLSPLGKYLAAAKLPISSSVSSFGIWLKDLQTGIERKIIALPTKGSLGPFLGIVGWLDE